MGISQGDTTQWLVGSDLDGIHADFYQVVGGWPTPLKNDGVKVTWDDEIPNWMEIHVPNHQSDKVVPQKNVMFIGLDSPHEN